MPGDFVQNKWESTNTKNELVKDGTLDIAVFEKKPDTRTGTLPTTLRPLGPIRRSTYIISHSNHLVE